MSDFNIQWLFGRAPAPFKLRQRILQICRPHILKTCHFIGQLFVGSIYSPICHKLVHDIASEIVREVDPTFFQVHSHFNWYSVITDVLDFKNCDILPYSLGGLLHEAFHIRHLQVAMKTAKKFNVRHIYRKKVELIKKRLQNMGMQVPPRNTNVIGVWCHHPIIVFRFLLSVLKIITKFLERVKFRDAEDAVLKEDATTVIEIFRENEPKLEELMTVLHSAAIVESLHYPFDGIPLPVMSDPELDRVIDRLKIMLQVGFHIKTLTKPSRYFATLTEIRNPPAEDEDERADLNLLNHQEEKEFGEMIRMIKGAFVIIWVPLPISKGQYDWLSLDEVRLFLYLNRHNLSQRQFMDMGFGERKKNVIKRRILCQHDFCPQPPPFPFHCRVWGDGRNHFECGCRRQFQNVEVLRRHLVIKKEDTGCPILLKCDMGNCPYKIWRTCCLQTHQETAHYSTAILGKPNRDDQPGDLEAEDKGPIQLWHETINPNPHEEGSSSPPQPVCPRVNEDEISLVQLFQNLRLQQNTLIII